MSNPLELEFEYYLKHQQELIEKYDGKFIVIKDAKVIGSYETAADAFFETRKVHVLGTFLIQRCSPGDLDYAQHFQSRVVFA